MANDPEPQKRSGRRRDNGGTGRRAEEAAGRWLAARGVKLLRKNYHSRYGEIDIIGYDGRYLVFVEVRFRSNPRFGSPEDSVDYRKQQKLVRTAQCYLRRSSRFSHCPCRFDVIVASQQDVNGNFNFRWHKNAFDAEC